MRMRSLLSRALAGVKCARAWTGHTLGRHPPFVGSFYLDFMVSALNRGPGQKAGKTGIDTNTRRSLLDMGVSSKSSLSLRCSAAMQVVRSVFPRHRAILIPVVPVSREGVGGKLVSFHDRTKDVLPRGGLEPTTLSL